MTTLNVHKRISLPMESGANASSATALPLSSPRSSYPPLLPPLKHSPSTPDTQGGLTVSRPSPRKTRNKIKLSASSTSQSYPASTLEKSIDFVVLNNIASEHLDALFDFLKGNGFTTKYDSLVPAKGWSFNRRRCFSVGKGTEVHVFYQPTSPYFKTLWIQIMHPTRGLLIVLDEFCDGRGITPRIRKLELSFDFISQDPGLMKEFIVAHLYLRHQRSKSKVFKGTFYTNDLRGSANGLRCYLKARKSEKAFTRFELHLAKGPVRQLGIKWLLNDLERFDLRKHFAFMEMDGARAVRTLVGRSAPTNPTDTLREKLKSKMWQRTAESWVRMETPEHVGLMKQVEQMKDRDTGLNKAERYFNLVAFNAVFFAAVSKLKFLP